MERRQPQPIPKVLATVPPHLGIPRGRQGTITDQEPRNIASKFRMATIYEYAF